MSLTSLARSGGPAGTTMKLAGVAPVGSQPSTQTPKDLLQAIATFIPGEVLTIYLGAEAAIRSKLPDALKAATAGAGTATKQAGDAAANAAVAIPGWATTIDLVVIGACILLTIAWIAGGRYLEDRGNNVSSGFPWWRIIAGVVAFVVYAVGSDAILLNGPNQPPSVTVGASLLLIFISPLLVFVDKLVGARWPNQSATKPSPPTAKAV